MKSVLIFIVSEWFGIIVTGVLIFSIINAF